MKSRARVVFTPARLARRVAEMGRAISRDSRGRTLDVVVILEGAFCFAADLVRQIRCPVRCHFVRTEVRDVELGGFKRREIFFGDRPQLKGCHVLLVDAVLQSGVPQEFLVRRLQESAPKSLRLAVLLEKPEERKVDLKPDYFGFATASNQLVGYGLPGPRGLDRNLRFIAAPGRAEARKRARAPRKAK